MANAWDNDPIESSGNAWDNDPIETPVKKKGQLEGMTTKDFLPTQEEQQDYLSTIKGLGEAGANVLSGMIGGGLGTLSGTIAGIRQHGIGTDEARQLAEKEAASQAEALTYQPRSEKGQEYAARAGKLMEQLIPVMPMAAELEGGAMATRNARALQQAAKPIAEGHFAPDVPLPLDKALEQADVLPENQKQVLGPHPHAWEADPIVEPASKQAKLQGELSLEEPAPPIAVTSQGTAMIDPAQVAGYERFGRQMETPEVSVKAAEEPIHVNAAGEATRGLPEPIRTITDTPEVLAEAQRQAEARTRELQAKAAVERGETGNLFADYINQHRDYELFRDENGRPLSREGFEKTIDNLEKEPRSMYVRPEDMNEAYRKYLENFNGVQAGLFDQPTTALAMSQALRKDAASRMVDNHPLIKAAEKFLSQEQQFLDQLKQQGATLEAIKDATRDVALATERVEKTKENVTKGIAAGKKPTALRRQRSGSLKNQKGVVSGDMLNWMLSLGLKDKFSREALLKKRIPIVDNENENKHLPTYVKKGLEDYTKERRSGEDIATDIIKNHIPDIKNTSMSDKLQAGGMYKGLETNNPIVRKTFSAISDAHNRAHMNIRNAIQDPKDGLPAIFRKLSKKEAGDIGALMRVNEGKADFTADQLRQQGYNDKQIHLYERMREVDNYALQKINQARAAAGKEPISARVGHLAGQASGDFRRLIFKTNKDGVKEIVGIVGADVRHILNKRVEAILKEHPEWEAGAEKMNTRGKKDNRQKAFEDTLELLAEHNPDTRALLDTYDKILKDDAYNYMNAKKHTMQKKGIIGTEGFKEGVSAWQNAKEGMASQIRYLEKVFQWAELSDAVRELRPLLTNDKVEMPNAKQWANDYIDRALGIQTSGVGNAIDGLLDSIGNRLGVGPSAIQSGVSFAKSAVSKTLLGFMNPMFLAINLVQPVMAMPAINSLLKSRGIHNANLAAMPSSIFSFAKMYSGKLGELTPFEKAIKQQGLERNVFGSEIFEHGTHLRKGMYYGSRLSELGIPNVEAATRGTVFTALAHTLNEAKIPHDKLFDIAENLTNQAMTDYRPIEAPSAYKELGSLGEMAVTLQRYKHNSLSSMAMLAREAKRNGAYRPLVTALATGIAFSGLTGMLGFNEADALYQMITKATGKPDTLTRLLMDSVDSDALNFGAVSALSGIDMSKRFGMQLFPDSASGVIFPGISRLGEMAQSAYGLATNPTSGVAQDRLLRDISPNSIRGMVERKYFEDESGLAHNPKTLAGTVQRTDIDKMAKNLGATGLHESKEKSRLYQESLVDKAYADRRSGTVSKIFQDLYPIKDSPEKIAEYFQSERGQELKQRFLDNEGNVDNLVSSVLKFHKATKLTQMQQKMLEASAATKEGDLKKAKRTIEMKRSLER